MDGYRSGRSCNQDHLALGTGRSRLRLDTNRSCPRLRCCCANAWLGADPGRHLSGLAPSLQNLSLRLAGGAAPPVDRTPPRPPEPGHGPVSLAATQRPDPPLLASPRRVIPRRPLDPTYPERTQRGGTNVVLSMPLSGRVCRAASDQVDRTRSHLSSDHIARKHQAMRSDLVMLARKVQRMSS